MREHGNRPTWDDFWTNVGGENWLAAKALAELSATVRSDVSGWLRFEQRAVYANDAFDAEITGYMRGGAVLDWEGWVADLDAHGRGWSSTENRLAALVAALVVPGRQVPVVGFLDCLGTWEVEVWRILTTWGTGGNNRDIPGRATVATTRRSLH